MDYRATIQLIVLLLFPLLGRAQFGMDIGDVALLQSLASAEAEPTELMAEDFEVAGDTVSAGWTDSNAAVDWGYTSTVLAGTESLFFPTNHYTTYVIGTPYSDASLSFVMEFLDAPTSNDQLCLLIDSAFATIGYVRVLSGNAQIVLGSTASTLISSYATETPYYIWLDYSTTGSEGTLNAYYSTDGEKPASPQATSVSSTGTNQLGKVRFKGSLGQTLFDEVLLTTP